MSRWVEEEWLLDYFADDIDYYGKYVREDIKDNMPSIEIIRCRECIHNTHRCHMAFDLIATEDDDFCSYGSRSEKPNNSKVSEIPTGSERSSK